MDDARKFGIKKSIINGILLGSVWLVINGGYALGFWYGWKLTDEEPGSYDVGKVIVVFFSIIIAVFSLGNASPFFETLTTAKTAAYEVFNIIDRVRSFIKYFIISFNANKYFRYLQLTSNQMKVKYLEEFMVILNSKTLVLRILVDWMLKF